MSLTDLVRTACWGLALVITLSSAAEAQPPANPADKTLLEIELMLPKLGSDPLLAQRWRKVFEELGEGVRIRQPLPSDTAKIEEVSRGPFRLVRVIGVIQRDGSVAFPEKSFQISQVEQLKEFLNELKTYGAQGTPNGKPLWGLTQDQFTKVYSQLTSPIDKPLVGQKLGAAVAAVPLREPLTLTFHSTAEPLWKAARETVLTEEVQGLSAGTSLAFLLSQAGLGFRPLRTPSGEIALTVHPLAEAADAWPVGWPLDENVPRDQLIPGLFQKVETGVQQAPLAAVLEAVETKSGVRILIDRRSCLQKQLDPDEILVTYPRKKTAWALLVSSVTVNSHMTMNYRHDEAGVGFLFLNPFEHYEPRASGSLPQQQPSKK